MSPNYTLKQKLIACILLLSLFLQSCSNFSNSLIPTDTREIEKEELSNQTAIGINPIATKQLIGKEFRASGGHLVTFDEHEGKLQAEVKINALAGFSKTYSKLPVIIAKDIDVRQLLQLSKEEQKRFVHFNRGKNGQVSKVLVYRSGLLGGGDTGNNTEKETKTNQDISRLSDIKGLRKYFYKGYLEITPANYDQLIKLAHQYESMFMSYEGGVYVKGWGRASDISRLIDLLILFSKIKKFKMNCLREDGAELDEVIVRGIQFYEELEEVDLGGCQLSECIVGDILESIVSAEKLRVLDVSNNKLSGEMIASLRRKFPNAEVRSSSKGSSENSSQSSIEGQVSRVNVVSSLTEKESDRLKEEEKEETYRKLANDLPCISYDNQRILDVLDALPMSVQVKDKAILHLKYIEGKLKEIESYRTKKHPEDFYGPMQGAILEIHNTAEDLYKFTSPYHLTLPTRLKALIIDSITSFERELNKRLGMPAEEKEILRIKTKRLYAGQSYICRQESLQKSLMEHLAKVKQLLSEVREEGEPSPRCYLSYAWPSRENKEEEYCVQPFLSILYDHLKEAGIEVIMDIRDNKPGDSIYQFMKRYKDGNHIILVGTESLLQKHYSSIFHAVQTELSNISNRPAQDQKVYGSSRICPLLVSGSIRTSFPEIYDKYRTVRDAIDKGYASTLRCLLDWIYERQINKLEARYTNLWRDFDANYSGLPNEADDSQAIEEELNIGYHRQKLDYLKQDLHFQAVQAQEQTRHSSAVGAKMVGVLMESQGNNPKQLYSEHGQRFQRPSITPDFIERKRLWDKIVAHFNQSEQQILTLSAHGLGGMGKTELAKYYYLCPPRPYALRVWFNAEDRELLYLQYIDLARVNGIEYEEKMPIQEQARQVKKWLETQKDCLLVYDNVPNAKQVEGLLPENGKHHILITSRNEVEWPAHQKIDIDVMEEHEAIALIGKITGCQAENERIKELVSTLHYMPLALAQAGAYIAEKQTNIEDYLNLYRKYQSIVMSDDTLARNPKHAPVWITFNMNFQALEEDCPSALTTLKQASWLDASVVPEILLKTMLQDSKDKPLELLWGDVKSHIGRYSLMRIDREGHELSMHRLLQDILRSKQQDELERKGILNQIALSIKRIYPESENAKIMENIALVRLLLPHMETTLSHLKRFFDEHECSDFNLEFNLGNAYETIGNYMKAKEHLLADLLIKQKKYKGGQIQREDGIYPSNHLDIDITLGNLGRACYYLGEYQEALTHFNQALEMTKAIHSDNHPSIATSLHNMGSVYNNLGEHGKALQYYEEAFEMTKAIHSGNHPSVAISLHNMGSVYNSLGEHKKALQYYEEAVEILRASYPINHPSVATLLNNIGSVYEMLNEHRKALTYYEQALEMLKATYPTNHPSVATLLNNIGSVYEVLNEHRKALAYYEQALEMEKVIYPGNHTSVATSLNNIGNLYNRIGEYRKVLHYLEQALEMKKAIYPGNHPDTAILLHNIGNLYSSLDEYRKALQYYEQALKMEKAIYTINHPSVATSLNNIGNLYNSLGEHREALYYLEQALEMLKAIYPINHSSVATLLSNIGSIYYSLGEYRRALQYYEKAFEMEKSIYLDNHASISIATLLNNIGSVYEMLSEYTKALSHYEQALEMRKAIYLGNHPYVAGSLNNIGSVYQNLGEPQEALKYYKQALEMYQGLYPGNHASIATLLNNIGSVHKYLGQNQEALKYHELALEMEKAIYPDNHPAIASSLNNIGSVYERLSEYTKALTCYEQALAMLKAIYSDNHPYVASLINNIGSIYNSLGKHKESLSYYEQALVMRQALYPANHPAIATSFNNIGNLYYNLGQHQEALKYNEQALAIRKALYKDNHPDIAGSLNNIGMVYYSLGQNKEALKYLEEQALKMRQALYSDKHPDIASSLNNIGMVYCSLGRPQAALKYYEQALKMWQALYFDNPNHPYIQKVKEKITQLQLEKKNEGVENEIQSTNGNEGLNISIKIDFVDEGEKKYIEHGEITNSASDMNLSLSSEPVCPSSNVYVALWPTPEKMCFNTIENEELVNAIQNTNENMGLDITIKSDLVNVEEQKYIEHVEGKNRAFDTDLTTSPSISPEPISNSATNSANKHQTLWDRAVCYVKGLASWWKTEAIEKEINMDNVYVKGLLTLKDKCQKLIQEASIISVDKWYVYSLEDMIEDIDEMVETRIAIDEDTLDYLGKRLIGIKKDFLEEQTELLIPYRLEAAKQLDEMQLLVHSLNMVGYQGDNVLALPQ
jgi:tetratricopeptide (TPR) repeat protein